MTQLAMIVCGVMLGVVAGLIFMAGVVAAFVAYVFRGKRK